MPRLQTTSWPPEPPPPGPHRYEIWKAPYSFGHTHIMMYAPHARRNGYRSRACYRAEGIYRHQYVNKYLTLHVPWIQQDRMTSITCSVCLRSKVYSDFAEETRRIILEALDEAGDSIFDPPIATRMPDVPS